MGIDDEGALERSDGGYLPARSPDDGQVMDVLAQIAFGWYGIEHRQLNVDTARFMEDMVIGSLVTTYGANGVVANPETVNAIVTGISIQWDKAEQPTAPMMSVTTWAGELDAQQVTRR